MLEEIQRDLPSLPGVGASALEVSHRSPWFTDVIDEAEANLRALLGIGDAHAVVFCQGGATQQFVMVPMNLLHGRAEAADYVVTGAWGVKAAAEAARVGSVREAWSGEPAGYVRVPTPGELSSALDPAAAYVHITTNETIQGVAFHGEPDIPAASRWSRTCPPTSCRGRSTWTRTT